MIVVVTPNPAVDVTYRVDLQQIGETQRVRSVDRRPGGKGINVARVLAAEGAATHSVLPLGGSTGDWVADRLDALGLPMTAVPIDGETRTTVTIVDGVAHPTMFGEPGPVVGPSSWKLLHATVRGALRTADTLVLSGSLPAGSPADVVRPMVAAARGTGALVVADLAGDALLAAASAGATICKPNRDELAAATGESDERAGAVALLDLGAEAVVVSRGGDGIAAHDRSGVVEVAAVPGVAGNPTGAGDAATAGLVLSLRTGASRHEALRSAAAFGAAAVLRPLAGEVDRTAAHRFLTSPDLTWSPA